MARAKLQAKERKIFGRKVKQLRKQGKIPANIFGPKTKSKAVTLDGSKFIEIFKQVGETGIIDLSVEGEKSPRPILISNLHLDPVTDSILHADLHQVDLKTKTTAEVQVETIGESPAVKTGGILVLLKNEIEVEALPEDLPDKIELDVSSLNNIGDSLLSKDININREKITLQISDDEPIVTIQEPAPEEEIPVPVEEETAEGEETEKDEETKETKEPENDEKPTEKPTDLPAPKPSSKPVRTKKDKQEKQNKK